MAECRYTRRSLYVFWKGGFGDRELLAATLDSVHRKELLNG